MWFQIREDVDAASTQALRDVVENEATVDSAEFALRLAVHNEGDETVDAKINVIVPIDCGLRFLDEGCGYVPTLPSAVDDLYPGETSVVRFAAAKREIGPNDFALVDLAVAFASGVPEIPIRGVLSDGSDDEHTEQITVRIA